MIIHPIDFTLEVLKEVREKLNEEEMERLGAIVQFDYSFSTGCRDGVITFGDVIIDTDSDEDMYDEDEDEYYA